MKARNMVIAGDYVGYTVSFPRKAKRLIIWEPGWKGEKWAGLDKNHVKNYEIINKESFTNGASAVAKGGLASFFLGAPGLLAGLSAKTDNIYWIAIEWRGGQRSLIEIDNNNYKLFLLQMF